MGQSSSRYQEPSLSTATPTSSTLPSSVAGASTNLQPDSPVDVGTDTANPSQSRRSSFRKSILKFVKPSNIRSRVNSDASDPRDVGRSWRNSRRWSKAHPDVTPTIEDSLPASFSDSSTAGPSTLPPSPLNKGKKRDMNSTLEEDEEYPDVTITSPNEASGLSSPIPLVDQDPDIVSPPSYPAADVLTVEPQPPENTATRDIQTSELGSYLSTNDASPVSEEDVNELASSPEPQSSAQPQQQQQETAPLSPRQFPPPGTLVVVQGIVHTTDVSRTNSNPPSASPARVDLNPPSSNSRPASGLDAGSEQSTSRTRNRLSALLRPRSASSRPASTIINDPPPTIPLSSPPDADSSGASSLESQVLSLESAEAGSTTPVVNEPADSLQDQPLPLVNQPPPAPDNRAPAISSSSIDVLGTLLSVAAAATAASLLTGSSEPILSSGLAPPNANAASSPMPNSSASTTSLPHLPSYPGSPTPTLPDTSAAGRAERMRQAWGTIRERLGLRPSAPSPGVPAGPDFNQGNGNADPMPALPNDGGIGSPTDTRELMLAEMARAFNIGLGLNGLGGLAPASNSAGGQTESEGGTSGASGDSNVPAEGTLQPRSHPGTGAPAITMPPEGSFERFLVDLQIDLRAALTQAEDETDAEQPLSQEQASESQPRSSPSQIPDDTGTAADSTASSPSAPSAYPAVAAHHDRPDSPGHQVNDIAQPDQAEVVRGEDDYADMPFLQDVSDSESEFDEDNREDEDYDEDDFQSAEHGSVRDQGDTESPNRPTTSGTGHIDASGRINWWRLYRFPPIVSPRMDTLGLRQPFVSGDAVPTSPNLTTPIPESSDRSSATATTETGASSFVPSTSPASQQSAPTPSSASTSGQTPARDMPVSQPPLHSVVPVIVVGLQSVNSEWRPEMPPQGENEGIDFFGQPTSEATGNDSENGDVDDLDGWGGQHHVDPGPGAADTGLDGTRGRGRARGWHSRAANAIRNLRPGRRNADVGLGAQPPAIAPGSRTFLIYVIGGYYPPDHSIVTGGPNILDSFEALLELADLLGQVKPPTVSKEEIDKSGLEIIKASEMAQHEKDGKVSSNCMDRCLICLDDYEPEDQIRVMSCRHAFHKGCVDEWLQKGRNNCPACRSTGVAADTHSNTTL